MSATRLTGLFNKLKNLHADERGNVALMMGILLVPLVGAVGYGIDYTRAVSYKLKLDSAVSAATLAGVDSARALLLSNPSMTSSELKSASEARIMQVFEGLAPNGVSSIFKDPLCNRVGDTMTCVLKYDANVPTTASSILGKTSIALAGESASTGNILGADGASPTNPDLLIVENFDKAAQVTADTISTYYSLFKDFNNWRTNKSGIEISKPHIYGVAPPNNAPYVAELDAAGNTFMARKVQLEKGNYELRYWYKDRIIQSDYAPAYLCGSKLDDIAWATSAASTDMRKAWGAQTNRIATYFTPATVNGDPPLEFSANTHTLIDVCASSGLRWIERSVKINITSPGYFWLAFQAEGAEDGYGGVLNNIRLCKNVCPGVLADNYPWAANSIMFSDSFETPSGAGTWQDRTLDNSGSNTAWNNLPTGWTTWPENQIDFMSWAKQNGVYSIELDASSNDPAIGNNRGISRSFILTPGYYAIKYYYRSHVLLPSMNECGLDVAALVAAVARSNQSNMPHDSMLISAYMDSSRLVTHPRSAATLRALSTWHNSDGTPETNSLSRLPKTRIDACASSAGTFTLRTANVKITKSEFYWLTIRAEGTGDAWGGVIDSVSLVALGGLSMTPPSGAIAIAAPGLAPGTPITSNNVQFLSN